MKLAIKKAGLDPIQEKLDKLSQRHSELRNQFPDDLKKILLEDKEWREMMEGIANSKSPEEIKNLINKVSIYEKQKALIDPSFKELVSYKAEMEHLIKIEMEDIQSLLNGESENKLIRSLQRLLLFGKPSKEKSLFFGLLFVILATTGIVGTTIGIMIDEGIRQFFGQHGLFSIETFKALANGYEKFMNIASWYVAFELLGLKGMNLLRKPIIKIDKTASKLNRVSEYGKKNTYMIEQNLKHLKNNVQKILRYSEDPKFAPLMIGEHAWAVDHISVAAENVDQVADFLEVQFEGDRVAKKINKKAAVVAEEPIMDLVQDLINADIMAYVDDTDRTLHMSYKNRRYTLTYNFLHGWIITDDITGEFSKMSGLSLNEIKTTLKTLFDEINIFDPEEK